MCLFTQSNLNLYTDGVFTDNALGLRCLYMFDSQTSTQDDSHFMYSKVVLFLDLIGRVEVRDDLNCVGVHQCTDEVTQALNHRMTSLNTPCIGNCML